MQDLGNKNNIEATRAAMKVAEDSRRIAEDSKDIAKDSKGIAEASKSIAELNQRDSRHMKVIAGLTLLFLPGAYIAVRRRPS